VDQASAYARRVAALSTTRLGELAARSCINACSADPRWEGTARFCGVAAKVLHYPNTDVPQAADSNFSSNIPLEPSGTGYVENLVRLQAQAAAR
jgi:hypothetical protein